MWTSPSPVFPARSGVGHHSIHIELAPTEDCTRKQKSSELTGSPFNHSSSRLKLTTLFSVQNQSQSCSILYRSARVQKLGFTEHSAPSSFTDSLQLNKWGISYGAHEPISSLGSYIDCGSSCQLHICRHEPLKLTVLLSARSTCK